MARPLHIRWSMRISTCLAYLVILLPAIAGADSKPTALPKLAKPAPAPTARTLEASDVAASIKPFNDDINHCYLAAAGDVKGAGHLEIKLSIHRTGALDSIDVSTPGLPSKTAKQISSCVKALVSDTRFPSRRSSTIAVVPYFYLHTSAPNSGPQLSCWDPNGCR